MDNVARTDQSVAASRDTAMIIASFHKTLKEQGVDAQTAYALTTMYASRMLSSGKD